LAALAAAFFAALAWRARGSGGSSEALTPRLDRIDLAGERLERELRQEVREAAQNDTVRPGLALVAPGDYHMSLRFDGARYRVQLEQGPPVHHVRPSVDVRWDVKLVC